MTSPKDCIRILICDDSRTYREAMRRFIEHDHDLCVADAVATGEEAVERVAQLDPDLVLMDLELPGMDGVEAVERILAARPVPILMLGGRTRRGSVEAARALSAGAIDARSKADIAPTDPLSARSVAFRRYLKRLGHARVATRRRPAAPAVTTAHRLPVTVSMIGIAASTGGPRALEQILRALPEDFPVPVLVVQHITVGFLDGLLSWLAPITPVPVAKAEHGAPVTRGVWFAPEDVHLVVDRRGRLHFDRETVSGWYRPSADVLFTSMAATVGAGTVGVVLTGMGSDGADGVAAIRASRGFVIAQDEQSSAIYGMPKAAADQGADLVLPLEEIADALGRLAKRVAVA